MPTNVPTTEEFNALADRVTALEEGQVNPPDPPDPPVDGEPSPDGTTATAPGTVLTSAALNFLELVDITSTGKKNYGIAINGTYDPVTHDVTTLYAKGGKIYQEAGGPWWYRYNDDGTWTPAQDPTLPAPNPGPDPVPPDGVAPNIIGLYTSSLGGETWNFGNGYDAQLLAGIAKFEQQTGKTVNTYDFFPTWGDQNWWNGNLNNMIWAMVNSGRKFIPCVGIKMFWSNTPPQNYGWGDPQGFRDNINGKYDSVWSGMVDASHNNGLTLSLYRISYEHNFSFMCDSPGWDSANQQLWKQAFEHISDVIRARAKAIGHTAQILFNPTCGQGSQPVESFAPSPSKYDICAADCYNGYYGDASGANDPAKRANFWATAYYGMDHHIALAKSHNRPVMYPETGAGTRPDGHGMANDAGFWNFMDSACKNVRGHSLRMTGFCFWDVPAGDINARFSNGAQPPCMDAVHTHLQSGSFVGDPLWVPASARAEVTQPPPAVASTREFPLSKPPTDELKVEPKYFNGRDHRAIKAWQDEHFPRREAVASADTRAGQDTRPKRK